MRAYLVKDLADLVQQACGELIERLIGSHHVEVEIWNDIGELQHLIQEMAVLGGGADLDGGRRLRLQPVNDRKQLDGFRTRPHHHEEIILHGWPFASVGRCWNSSAGTRRRRGRTQIVADEFAAEDRGKQSVGLAVPPPHAAWLLVDAE